MYLCASNTPCLDAFYVLHRRKGTERDSIHTIGHLLVID